ncbi:RDD domain containing protein [Halothece sp. PCC 7418]|uniref:RDD family protein n=1 Tax=Halothece sp. (strain PCC 7418) TaxID=65093 RepID=UPI0002A08910|nr:RDD family protein [Halothece sp. PCC 7418]AFZ42974.1 RDD domain containing protein [Halothece sp. PCC 7418]
MFKEPLPYRYPRVPIQRRIYAFLLDFAVAWFVSALVGVALFQFIVFVAVWYGLRVFGASRFKGQSLGRWAFDLQIIDGRRGRLPDVMSLTKREGGLSLIAFLGLVGLQYGFPNFLSITILISPLLVDLVVAIGDEENQQAIHDRFFDTVVVPSRRGYSLDLRIRRWVDLLMDRMR